MAVCPECESTVDIDEGDVELGDELSCAECGSLLRVAHESPVELESVDDDDDEDEEDDVDDDKKDDDDDDDEESDEDSDDSWNDREE